MRLFLAGALVFGLCVIITALFIAHAQPPVTTAKESLFFWSWPKGLDPQARLVSIQRVQEQGLAARVVLGFQEPSGAVRLVSAYQDVTGLTYTTIILSPR